MTKLEIPPQTVVKTVLVLAVLILLWQIKFILLYLVIAYILMSGFAPLVDYLHKETKLSYSLSVAITFLVSLVILFSIFFVLIPPLIGQLVQFFRDLPAYSKIALESLGITNDQLIDFTSKFSNLAIDQFGIVFSNVFKVSQAVISSIFAFFLIVVLTFYLLIEKDSLEKYFLLFFPHWDREKINLILKKIERKMGAWLRSQFLLALSVGIPTWLFLAILGVPFALPLALLAGILEIVPMIGPILAGLPAVLVALNISPAFGITVGLFYLVLQQIENSFLVPKLIEKTMGLNPLLTVIALLIGGELLGILGAFLALPLTSAGLIILEETRVIRREK
ncbi:MAG: hypothetical protein A2Y57_04395 [Candidatus Woykebacteria bacterium RBG_13_40_7b]|uniref:AI-2E family transporter n=1 Tax=Candidatus Woykebacteria bacterium RBG_13_40_7b TaxID=1802594 RepID=A0A1G1W7T1_9BACT|nr:MAG: hypothetical protein A2Y57_04395 [Candidatus Woykebacteria bacterium RBG_13_40_7b]